MGRGLPRCVQAEATADGRRPGDRHPGLALRTPPPCPPGPSSFRPLPSPRLPCRPLPPLGISWSSQPLIQARKSGVFSHLTRVSINSAPAPANPRHRRQKEAN